MTGLSDWLGSHASLLFGRTRYTYAAGPAIAMRQWFVQGSFLESGVRVVVRLFRRVALVTALLAVPLTALAEQTRFGVLQVTDAAGGQSLTYRGEQVAGVTGEGVSVLSVHHWRTEEDVAVVFTTIGDDACHGLFQFVTLPAAGPARATGPAGECFFGIKSQAVSADRIELTIPGGSSGVEWVKLVFDGRGVTERRQMRTEAGAIAAGPGEDVQRWSGRFAREVLLEPSERLRFLEIMSRTDVLTLMEDTTTGGRVSVRDGLIIGLGCNVFGCASGRAGFAVDIGTGRPYAAHWSAFQGLRVFGARAEALPPAFRAALGLDG